MKVRLPCDAGYAITPQGLCEVTLTFATDEAITQCRCAPNRLRPNFHPKSFRS